MNIPAQARKDIKYISSLMRGLMALDEALDEAGSAEKLTETIQAQITDLTAKKDAATKALQEAQSAAESKQAECDELIEQAKADAADAQKQASSLKDEAAAVMEQAKSDAAGLLAAAQKDADDLKAGRSDEMNRLAAAITLAKGVLDGVNADIASAKQTKTDIETEISNLKQKFGG